MDGWGINYKRVERIWRQEGLKIPMKHKPRKRLWLNDSSCIRLRPAWKNHVWSYDFVQCRTVEGKVFRILVVIDEFSRECLALHVARSIRAEDVMHALADHVSRTVCLVISVRTTDRNLLPNHCESGSKILVCRHNTFSPAVLGKTAIAKVLTANFVIIFLMVKFLQPCRKQKYSLKHGVIITIRADPTVHWAADPQRP